MASGVTRGESKPWSQEQRDLQSQIFANAQTAYNATGKTGFQGQIYAPMSGQTATYLGGLEKAGGQDYGQAAATKLATDTANGVYLGAGNPYMKQAMGTAVAPLTAQYRQQVVPGIADKAVQQGAYGGSREGVAQGVAGGKYLDAVGNTTGQMAYQNYSDERNRQMQAPTMLGQAAQVGAIPLGYQQQAGALQDQFNQQGLNDAFQKYQMAQQAPWNGLSQFAQIGLTNTGQDTFQDASSDVLSASGGGGGWGGAAKGAVGGAATGAMVGGWPGAIVGGVAGGVSGYYG